MPVTRETGLKGWESRRQNGTVTWAKEADEWLDRIWRKHYNECYPSMGQAYTLTKREMARVLVTFPYYQDDLASRFQGETMGYRGLTQEILEDASGVPLEKFRKMAETPVLLIKFDGKGSNARWRLTWRTLKAFDKFGVPTFYQLAESFGGPPIKIVPQWWVTCALPCEIEEPM